MVAEVGRQGRARRPALRDSGEDLVARHDHGAGEQDGGADRQACEVGPDRRHRPVEIDGHGLLERDRAIGQKARGITLELLKENPICAHKRLDLSISRAGNAQTHGQRTGMARQADHPHVMAEIFSQELRAEAHAAGAREHRAFELEVAKRPARRVAGSGQIIERARRGELDRFQALLGRKPSDHDREVVGRAGGRAEGADFLVQKSEQPLRLQQSLGFLEKKSLVG